MRELNPPEAARSYSSVKDFRDSFSAAGHHDSTLDSKTGWTPARSELGGEPWVQIDAGESVQLWAVVVQSWHNWGVHGVSKVRVETSDDARSWTKVEGGRTWGTEKNRPNGRNRCAFHAAVTCRYVRVVGVDFSDRGGNGTRNGHGASMRCGLVVSTEPAHADTAPPTSVQPMVQPSQHEATARAAVAVPMKADSGNGSSSSNNSYGSLGSFGSFGGSFAAPEAAPAV